MHGHLFCSELQLKIVYESLVGELEEVVTEKK